MVSTLQLHCCLIIYLAYRRRVFPGQGKTAASIINGRRLGRSWRSAMCPSGSQTPAMLSRKVYLCVLLTVLLGSACGRRRPAARIPSSLPAPRAGTRTAEAPRPGYTETGYASWYGDPYHGRRAANGEIYDKNKWTAAHLTLPFGTQVKVNNLENNQSVVVRITDRGPFVKGRIIDLSLAAARDIRMVGPGTALVRLEILSPGNEPGPLAFAVQVGAFRERATAERLQERLKARYGNAFIVNYDSGDGRFYRVRVGPKPSLLEAHKLAAQLGSEPLPTFVVRLDN